MQFFANIIGATRRSESVSATTTNDEGARKRKEFDEDEYLREWELRNSEGRSKVVSSTPSSRFISAR
jgi:hypothetical protein